MSTKPCIICDKDLDSAVATDDWTTWQPSAGGEVQLIFSYGSEKFDLDMNATKFRGVVCDDCAEKIMHKLERFE